MDKVIVIADKSEIIRKGIASIVRNFNIFDVIAEAACSAKAAEAIKGHRPLVLLINPSMITEEGIKELRQQNEGIIEIVAIVYNLFDTEYMDLFDDMIMISDTRQKIRKKFSSLLNQTHKENLPKAEETLSSREVDVLKLLVKGHSNKEISSTLFISPHTVISHRKKITQKLNIKSVSGLTVYAILNDLISMDDIH